MLWENANNTSCGLFTRSTFVLEFYFVAELNFCLVLSQWSHSKDKLTRILFIIKKIIIITRILLHPCFGFYDHLENDLLQNISPDTYCKLNIYIFIFFNFGSWLVAANNWTPNIRKPIRYWNFKKLICWTSIYTK